MLVAGACGGSGDGKPTAAPSPKQVSPTASPSETTDSVNEDPGAKEGIEGARAALGAFLKGQAAGDSSVCRYVAEGGDFVTGPALKGDCRKGVRTSPHLFRPRERLALSEVLVTGGRITKSGEAELPFSGLRWSDGHMSESTLQPTFVLRRSDEGVWQIIR
ncbi:hypothetical protein [Actinomadura sp. B10D3]|uniref:hypothetical protein n=1 Tax=Actinomadura sp. B10D3 TaxID=3153557 RepID=UPI00325DCA2B